MFAQHTVFAFFIRRVWFHFKALGFPFRRHSFVINRALESFIHWLPSLESPIFRPREITKWHQNNPFLFYCSHYTSALVTEPPKYHLFDISAFLPFEIISSSHSSAICILPDLTNNNRSSEKWCQQIQQTPRKTYSKYKYYNAEEWDWWGGINSNSNSGGNHFVCGSIDILEQRMRRPTILYLYMCGTALVYSKNKHKR